jgi:hypothetical protein
VIPKGVGNLPIPSPPLPVSPSPGLSFSQSPPLRVFLSFPRRAAESRGKLSPLPKLRERGQRGEGQPPMPKDAGNLPIPLSPSPSLSFSQSPPLLVSLSFPCRGAERRGKLSALPKRRERGQRGEGQPTMPKDAGNLTSRFPPLPVSPFLPPSEAIPPPEGTRPISSLLGRCVVRYNAVVRWWRSPGSSTVKDES